MLARLHLLPRSSDLPSWAGWVGRVSDINEDDTGLALVGPRRSTDSVDEVGLRVSHNVVRSTDGKALEMSNEILVVAECNRGSRVNVDQLLHVEDLDSVSFGFAANDHQVILATDFAPSTRHRVCWKASKVR